jgi:hypothetical protein
MLLMSRGMFTWQEVWQMPVFIRRYYFKKLDKLFNTKSPKTGKGRNPPQAIKKPSFLK